MNSIRPAAPSFPPSGAPDSSRPEGSNTAVGRGLAPLSSPVPGGAYFSPLTLGDSGGFECADCGLRHRVRVGACFNCSSTTIERVETHDC